MSWQDNIKPISFPLGCCVLTNVFAGRACGPQSTSNTVQATLYSQKEVCQLRDKTEMFSGKLKEPPVYQRQALRNYGHNWGDVQTWFNSGNFATL